MVEQYIAPVKHTTASAAANTAAGAAKGGFFGFLKGVGVIAAIGAGVGLVGSLLLTGIVGLPAFAGVELTAAMGNWAIVGLSTLGCGIAAAFAGGPVAGTIGALIGGVSGGSKAIDKVHQETGRAHELQAQIDMIRAQNPMPAATNIYVPTATNDNVINTRYALPEQGSQYNPASAKIQGTTVQYDGLAAGQQLAAMR